MWDCCCSRECCRWCGGLCRGLEEWDQGQWELVGALLDAVSLHLEPTDCTLIADRGLAGWPLVKLCRDRKFHSLLRVCKEHTCERQDGTELDLVVCLAAYRQSQRTAVVWAGLAATQDQTIETYLSAVWDEHCQEAWFLISDLPAGKRRIQEYAWRMRKDRDVSG